MSKRNARTRSSTIQEPGGTNLEGYGKELAEWPKSWMGDSRDEEPGERIVAYVRPFLKQLIGDGRSRKTIRKHIGNLWLLGGEIIRDLQEQPPLRKTAVEMLVNRAIQDGGPLLYHNDSEEQQRGFDATCNQLRRFLQEQTPGPGKRPWK